MSTKQEIINNLKERIGAIEWMGRHDAITSYPLGIDAIDASLKHGGLTAGSCHEIIGSHDGAALGFIMLLVSSMTKKGPVMWCSPQQDFYTPGFSNYGIKDTDIIFIETNDHKQALWATETSLSCPTISAVLLHTTNLSLAQGRRLKLLAHKHNTTALFMLKPGATMSLPTIASTRWHIRHEPSQGSPSRNSIKSVSSPRLSIHLLRNLYGHAPLSWTVEFDEHALRFHTVPQLLPSTHQNRAANASLRRRERIA